MGTAATPLPPPHLGVLTAGGGRGGGVGSWKRRTFGRRRRNVRLAHTHAHSHMFLESDFLFLLIAHSTFARVVGWLVGHFCVSFFSTSTSGLDLP